MESNVGKWDVWYKDVKAVEPYGDTVTYQMGADFLADCALVEDWGCGKGWFRRFCKTDYLGLDGSHSIFADRVVDLAEYRSQVPGIYMRHVLEHNYDWQKVFENALASFTEKFCLVLFTPWPAEETKELAFFPEIGVPDLAFTKDDILGPIEASGATVQNVNSLPTETFYQVETVFYITR